MQTEHGITIENIRQGSLAEKSGLLRGDTILSVNSHRLRDPIDFVFYSADDHLSMEVKRDGKKINLQVEREDNKEFGIDFKPFRIMTCRNNCIFCFVKQLPKGLRKTLYVKDEDYRMSFLYGNYITLCNLSKEDKRRIVEQRLSPLYISVHSTNRTVRNKLLGNAKGLDILKEIKFLTDNKVRLNIQIVLCPDYNDGDELYHTISNLYRFYPYVLSVAVVPVGLTIHRKQNVRPVKKEDAESAIRIIESFQKRFMKKHGNPIVYAADELYLKAERAFPPLREYGELHQIENGVGMLPLFVSQARKLKISRSLPRKRNFITFTGASFYPFLKKFVDRLVERESLHVDVRRVENHFFGSSITVGGLLTGRDIIRTILDSADAHDVILVPDVALDREDRFLDDISLKDLEAALNVSAKKVISTPEGFVKGMAEA
jgi:putative radical SAM enzyme (TIGR03279 family)